MKSKKKKSHKQIKLMTDRIWKVSRFATDPYN